MKAVYYMDYIYEQPSANMVRPGASPKPPQRPSETVSDPVGPSVYASPPPHQQEMDESSTTEESNDSFFAGKQSLPSKYWIPKGIQKTFLEAKGQILSVLIDVKEHVTRNFPRMAPPFGLVAWFQFQHMQYLQKIASAENFEFVKLRLGSLSNSRARELEFQAQLENMSEAVDKLEASVAAAKETCKRNAANELARLQSVVAEGQGALAREQQSSKTKIDEMAQENARLHASIKEKDKRRMAAEAKASRHEEVATEAREQVKAAEERALQAETKLDEAAELAEASKGLILQQQTRNDILADSLATSSSALIQAIAEAGKAKEKAERTEKALQEQIAELVEEQKKKAAQSTAHNKKLEDKLAGEREARQQVTSNDDEEDQRVKDAEEGRRRAEEAARRAKGEADHLVKSQLGQFNRAKALNDAYRAKYGQLDGFKTTKASDLTASSADTSSSVRDANYDGTSQPPTDDNGEHENQCPADSNPVSVLAGVSRAPQRSTSLSN